MVVNRGRKRKKPHSDSESYLSQQATTCSTVGRPKRSVKRKNYAAMVASASESLEDENENDEQRRIKKVLDKGKSLMKNGKLKLCLIS